MDPQLRSLLRGPHLGIACPGTLDDLRECSPNLVVQCKGDLGRDGEGAALFALGPLHVLAADGQLVQTTSRRIAESWATLIREAIPRERLRREAARRHAVLEMSPEYAAENFHVVASRPGPLTKGGEGAVIVRLKSNQHALAADGRVIPVSNKNLARWAQLIKDPS